MIQEEFFGDWYRYVDKQSLKKIITYLKNNKDYLPEPNNVFKAFTLCPAKDINAIFLFQDPYSTPGIATGIACGNSISTPEDNLSPSLKILKEAVIDYEKPHNIIIFDNTLESWAKQGIMMLNSALTVKTFQPNSHLLYWREFISKFLQNFSENNFGILYVLFGKQAQSFENYIKGKIIKCEHPAAIARNKSKLPHSIFTEIKDYIYKQTGKTIQWFFERDYGEFIL